MLLDSECEDFEQVLQTNLLGPFRLGKAVLGPMLLRGRGVVVAISSDAAVEAYPEWGMYGVLRASGCSRSNSIVGTPRFGPRCTAQACRSSTATCENRSSCGRCRPCSPDDRGRRDALGRAAAERYEIPAETVAAIRSVRGRGGRVIAVGTTVVRALESEAAAILEHGAEPRTLAGVTELVLTPGHRRRIVDALLTGMHGPGESHYRLLGSFLDRRTLERAWTAALDAGYRSHEFGDLALLHGRTDSC